MKLRGGRGGRVHSIIHGDLFLWAACDEDLSVWISTSELSTPCTGFFTFDLKIYYFSSTIFVVYFTQVDNKVELSIFRGLFSLSLSLSLSHGER